MNTMQQEFDAVVTHLYKQGRPAMTTNDHNDICAYRGRDETMCAVGCRIPDDIYEDIMEGSGIRSLIGSGEFNLPEEIYEYEEMFNNLQNVHDMCDTTSGGSFIISDLKSRLETVAAKFDLTFTEPT